MKATTWLFVPLEAPRLARVMDPTLVRNPESLVSWLVAAGIVGLPVMDAHVCAGTLVRNPESFVNADRAVACR